MRSPRRSSRPGAAYGTNTALAGHAVNLEFVSANPTGPMHIGGTRWAAARRRARPAPAAPPAPTSPREYYFNDAGAQIDRFARARCWPRRTGEPAPEDGYAGDYIADIAARGASPSTRTSLDLPDGRAAARSSAARGVDADVRRDQADSLHDFGVDFDVYFHENDAARRRRGRAGAVARLREQGHVYEADGAVWLRTTDFGDDKDRVLIKTDGEPTYIAADCAYYLDKRERGFDRA